MVGPAVIGGDMDCGDLMAALRLDGVYECIAVWSKPVARSQSEKGVWVRPAAAFSMRKALALARSSSAML
jgi:hypothetical protein